jgi:hypothetical protein
MASIIGSTGAVIGWVAWAMLDAADWLDGKARKET